MIEENVIADTDSWTSAPTKKKSKVGRKQVSHVSQKLNGKVLNNSSNISPTSVTSITDMGYEEHVYYRLSEFQNEGGCLRCVTKTCNITGKHGISYPEEFAFYVKNPTKIGNVASAIFNASLDFNKKTPLYAICNYNSGKCKNCENGRIKYVKIDDYDIPFCYPDLLKVRNKATIGIHADVKVTKKGQNCEAFIYPIQQIQQLQNNDQSYDTYSIGSNSYIKDININNNYFNENITYMKDSYESYEYIDINEIKNDEPFPILVKDNIVENNTTKPKLDFSRVKDINLEIMNEEKKKMEDENKTVEINVKVFSDIQSENNSLKRRVKEYEYVIHSLKRDLNKIKYSNPDPEIAPEVIYNLKRVNNRVSDDFMRAKYPTFNI